MANAKLVEWAREKKNWILSTTDRNAEWKIG